MTDEVIKEDIVSENEDVEAADGSESGRSSEEEAPPTLQEQLEALQTESARHLDGWQRALADLANARRRFEKQSQLAYTNATVEVVSQLLPVIDDFDRALENVPADIAENSWFDGLSGTLRKLNNILDKINVERIPSVGETFDPNFHDALSAEPSDEYESGVVTRELQAGYKVGDRVIRPALVYVAA